MEQISISGSIRVSILITLIILGASCGPRPGTTTPDLGESADADGDGIADTDDLCPAEAEDPDGFEDGNGCPDPDNDADGIDDVDDDCPDESEVYNGVDDLDGCPDESKPIVHVPNIVIFDTIQIAQSEIELSNEIKEDLDLYAQTLIGNPHVLVVLVAGAANEKVSQEENIALSLRWAETVVQYMEGKGVPEGVLVAAGFGKLCLDPNWDKIGKARRVEFRILETDAGCTKATFACQAAIDKGLVPKAVQKCLSYSDADKDGIPDSQDMCPDDPEVYQGLNDEDGCPDSSASIPTGTKIPLADSVTFKEGSKKLPKLYISQLDQVADWIMNAPPPVKILVLGYSGFGEAGKDQGVKLSKARAEAVAGYLTKKGVGSDDLITVGLGVACSHESDNPAYAGKVRFKVLEYGGKCVYMMITCNAAFEKNLIPESVLEYEYGGKACTSK